MSEMPPHVHPGDGFEDIDVSGRPGLKDWHVAYRVGAVGEESGDAAAPYIPLSLSYSERKVPANMRTLRYGLVRDFWQDIGQPSESDVRALMNAALARLASDIEGLEGGDESARARHFVRPI